eukprot:3839731-Karenia_brevis.AAC.1
MLVEPIRHALMLAREWSLPIAVGSTDVDAAFESLPHQTLLAGWESLGAPPQLVAGFYREMLGAEAQIVMCGE